MAYSSVVDICRLFDSIDTVSVYTIVRRWRMLRLLVCVVSVFTVWASEHELPACKHDIGVVMQNAVSQDVLYNTAMVKCQKGVFGWKYEAMYTAPPPKIVSQYGVPADSRIHCARALMRCDTPIDGPLGLLMSTAHTNTIHEVCVRGAHVYGVWTLSIPTVFDKLQLTHDMHIDATKTTLTSSDVEGEIVWPFSMFKSQIKKIVEDASIDASAFYLQRLCNAY